MRSLRPPTSTTAVQLCPDWRPMSCASRRASVLVVPLVAREREAPVPSYTLAYRVPRS